MDATRRYFLYVNDCAASTGIAADCNPGTSGTLNAVDVTLTLDLTSWGLPSGTVLVANLVHTTSHGAVSALPALSRTNTVTVSAPAGSALMIVGPRVGTQTAVNVTAIADTTLTAGTGANTASGSATTLTVSTSATANHATTRAAVLSFPVPATASGRDLTAAVLELTLSSASTAYMPLSVFGLSNCSARWSEAAATWASSAALGIDTAQPMNAAFTSLSQARGRVAATFAPFTHVLLSLFFSHVSLSLSHPVSALSARTSSTWILRSSSSRATSPWRRAPPPAASCAWT